jgi:choline dehydrogenase-like flavoprotein
LQPLQHLDGFLCLAQAKADAHVVAVNTRMCLLTDAYVERIETGVTGREAREVVVRRYGVVEPYRADLVVVGAGAVNSAALLLGSASVVHPDGLANGSGVVGRHYMYHNNSVLIAISQQPNPTRFQKTLGLNDFYFGSRIAPPGHIQMLGKTDAAMFRGESHGLLRGSAAGKLASHALDFWLSSGASAERREPGLARARRRHPPPLHPEQPRAARKADQEAPAPARAYRLQAASAAA